MQSSRGGSKAACGRREGAGITSGWYCIATGAKEPLPGAAARGLVLWGSPWSQVWCSRQRELEKAPLRGIKHPRAGADGKGKEKLRQRCEASPVFPVHRELGRGAVLLPAGVWPQSCSQP